MENIFPVIDYIKIKTKKTQTHKYESKKKKKNELNARTSCKL